MTENGQDTYNWNFFLEMSEPPPEQNRNQIKTGKNGIFGDFGQLELNKLEKNETGNWKKPELKPKK